MEFLIGFILGAMIGVVSGVMVRLDTDRYGRTKDDHEE